MNDTWHQPTLEDAPAVPLCIPAQRTEDALEAVPKRARRPRIRPCEECGETKKIVGKDKCQKCYDIERWGRIRAERGPTPPREYTCADCGEIGYVTTKSSKVPNRCPECTSEHDNVLRRVRQRREYADNREHRLSSDRVRRAANKARLLEQGFPKGEKPCPMCGETKRLDEFPVNWSKADGRHAYCKPCYREQDRVRRNEMRAQYRAATDRWQESNPLAARLTGYKLDVDGYLDLLEIQHRACAICAFTPDDPFSLFVDHDHADGIVRGLLDNKCNTGIGFFNDDPELLRRAADYIEAARKSTGTPST